MGMRLINASTHVISSINESIFISENILGDNVHAAISFRHQRFIDIPFPNNPGIYWGITYALPYQSGTNVL